MTEIEFRFGESRPTRPGPAYIEAGEAKGAWSELLHHRDKVGEFSVAGEAASALAESRTSTAHDVADQAHTLARGGEHETAAHLLAHAATLHEKAAAAHRDAGDAKAADKSDSKSWQLHEQAGHAYEKAAGKHPKNETNLVERAYEHFLSGGAMSDINRVAEAHNIDFFGHVRAARTAPRRPRSLSLARSSA